MINLRVIYHCGDGVMKVKLQTTIVKTMISYGVIIALLWAEKNLIDSFQIEALYLSRESKMGPRYENTARKSEGNSQRKANHARGKNSNIRRDN